MPGLGAGPSGGGQVIFYGSGGGAFFIFFIAMFAIRMFMQARRRGNGTWGGGGPGRSRGGGPWGNGQQNLPGQQNQPGGWPGSSGSPSGPGPGGASGRASGPPAGGDQAWEAGGGPAGGGWASTGAGGDAGIAAGTGHGAGAHLGSTGSMWPGTQPDWMNDPRPAAASLGGELFPAAHARAVQAASPVDVGLAAIKSHDPGFELEQFTQQVQRVFFLVEEAWMERKPERSRQVMADALWQTHQVQVQGYIGGHKRNMLDNLTVSNIWPVAAHSDNRFDTITMRLVAASADYDVDESSGRVLRGDKQVKPWEEDWTFQRSSSAQTKVGGTTLGSKCPNCGAPLDVDLAGTCFYCKASIMSGDYDWVLARISQVG